MDANLKAKWVEALRSGKYKQGRNYLNSKGAFCCLGVLCDLSGEGKWELELGADAFGDEMYRYLVGDGWNRATLPPELAEKYGVHNPGPLITMNDTGKSFTEIADYIEANL